MAKAIQVENVSKQYRLGQIGTGSLSHDINRWWHTVRGKEDPYLKIGESNDRTTKGNSEYVWSLRDISFEIEQGDSVGIIGRNGAGKSTLLKILSRVTAPTTGSVKVKGRIASLLEVGTGFHPELSGRDNIYLNGAILGMRKAEIKRKFDEIVDFAGVERYIDTPVKRYSSGMYVRLAFAVAAHLESEILIVDEVLAVGDAEFQKKCLGKMGEVNKGEGRTVLFVSHNLHAIKNLCEKGILFENGILKCQDKISRVVEEYAREEDDVLDGNRSPLPESSVGYFTTWGLKNRNEFTGYSRDCFDFEFSFFSSRILKNAELGFIVRDATGEIIYGCNSRDSIGNYIEVNEGMNKFSFSVRLPIKHGRYEIDIALVQDNKIVDQWVPKNKLVILNKHDSVLGDQWTGLVQELSTFHHA